jgi:hypothetical protein
MNSLQHYNGFRTGYLPLDSDMEPGHAKGRKGRTMYNHESSKSDYTCIFLEEPLTDCSLGNDCCYRVGSAHRLEGRGQRKR